MQKVNNSMFDAARPTGGALPNDSQCPVCGYFDLRHPAVIARIQNMAMVQRSSVGCRCKGEEGNKRSADALRWHQANLPAKGGRKRTFETFTQLPGTEAMVAACRRFANAYTPGMLVLVGSVGAGKTHMLEAIARHRLTLGDTVRYEFCPAFLTYLRSVAGNATEENLHDVSTWYNMRRLVLLDDLAVREQKETAFGVEQLTTLIESRLTHGLPTVIGTNQTKAEIAATLSDRLASRLFGDSAELGDVAVVGVNSKDYRTGETQ
jgi:chromosomal replication initiation ATPase DnaA